MKKLVLIGLLFLWSPFLFAQGGAKTSGGGAVTGSSGAVNITAGGTNQNITLTPSGTGTSVIANLQDKGGQVFNVEAYGAKGDSTTDDTTAIQNVLDMIDGVDGSSCNSTPIFLPKGEYVITKTLVYVGNDACAATIEGSSGPAHNTGSTTLDWQGPSGEPMFLTMGANQLTIKNVTFNNYNGSANSNFWITGGMDVSGTITQAVTSTGSQTVTVSSTGNMAAGYMLPVDSGANFEIVKVTAVGSGTITADFSKTHANGATIGGYNSNGVYLINDSFINSGSGEDGIRIGQYIATGTACGQDGSYIYADNFHVGGNAGNAAVDFLCGGNVKDAWFKLPDIGGFSYAFDLSTNAIVSVDGGNIDASVTQFAVRNDLNLVIKNTEEETNGIPFVDNIAGGYTGSLIMENNNLQELPGSGVPIIKWFGPVILIDNQIGNATDTVAELWINWNTSHEASVTSIGNIYSGASLTEPPIYDYNGGILLRSQVPGSVTSLGDFAHSTSFTNPYALGEQIGPERPPATFSLLPACAAAEEGQQYPISDSTTNTWGATITGGGSDHVLGYCDGTNWTVVAK